EIAEELVNAALACGRVDLVEALTYPLPVIVIAEIIGIPTEDHARFKVWSDAAVENLGAVFMGPLPPEKIARQRRVRLERQDHFPGPGGGRRPRPRADPPSGLRAGERGGPRVAFDERVP